MSNIPTLKPREVSAILTKLGFKEVRQRGSHKQYRDTQMDVALQFPSMLEIFQPFCYVKLLKILV
jgi:predicted RNA binding protein YcfA (HicA-like mRNA interferase family)